MNFVRDTGPELKAAKNFWTLPDIFVDYTRLICAIIFARDCISIILSLQEATKSFGMLLRALVVDVEQLAVWSSTLSELRR